MFNLQSSLPVVYSCVWWAMQATIYKITASMPFEIQVHFPFLTDGLRELNFFIAFIPQLFFFEPAMSMCFHVFGHCHWFNVSSHKCVQDGQVEKEVWIYFSLFDQRVMFRFVLTRVVRARLTSPVNSLRMVIKHCSTGPAASHLQAFQLRVLTTSDVGLFRSVDPWFISFPIISKI